ncbi:DUF2341 domain-containing protein [Ekhidna sp.]
MKFLRFYLLLSVVFAFNVYGQTGPGGVESNDGTSNLQLWLRPSGMLNGSSLPASNGEIVETWLDASGYGHNGVTNDTDENTNGVPLDSTIAFFNGFPGLVFTGDFPGLDGYVVQDINDDPSEATVMIVLATSDFINNVGVFVGYDNGNVGSTTPGDKSIGVWVQDDRDLWGRFIQSDGTTRSFSNTSTTNLVSRDPYIITVHADGATTLSQYANGTLANAQLTYDGTLQQYVDLLIGRQANEEFSGHIAEVLVFNKALSDAERIIVDNYLATKYGIGDLTNDKYVFDNTHFYDVAGIGAFNGTTHASAFSDNIIGLSNPSALADDDWILFGHDGGDAATWSTNEPINGDANLERLSREWRFDVTNTPGTVTVTVNPADLPALNADFGFYTLWVDSDGDFSTDAVQYPLVQNGSVFEATGVTIEDGVFATIAAYRPEINFTQTNFGGLETSSPATFEINIAYAVDDNITVDYTVGGTCTEDLPSAGTFTITAGNTTTSLAQPITSGDGFEPDETIILTLTGGSQSTGILGASVSTYTVNDDGASATNSIQFDAPFNYTHKKSITIAQSMVSGSTDLVDFPVQISFTDADLATIANGGNVTNSSGYDIRFTYDNAVSWLDHEIESYDETTGEYTAWVRLPVLAATENTVLEMFYGNSSVSTDPSTTGVWVDYHVVFHMNDNDDSSPNGYNGTIQAGSTDIVAGIAGQAQYFDGNDVFQISSSMPELNTEFTISMWMRTDDINNNARLFHDDNGSTGYALSLGDGSAGNLRSFQRGFPGAGIIDAVNTLAQDTWYHLNFVVDRTNFHRIIYVDGASDISDLSDNSGSTWQTHTGANGNVTLGGEDNSTARRHIGFFDEVRVSSVVRNADWIATEYNSMDPSGSYLSLGTEEAITVFDIDESTDTLNLTISLSGIDVNDVNIDYAITSGTASNGSDYIFAAGTATITAGNLSTVITVDITDDSQDEMDETFTVSLTNPSSVSNLSLAANNEIEITLVDNDDGPTIAASDISLFVNEGADINSFAVDLDVSSGQAVTVDYAIADISATNGADYVLSSGTLTIPADSTSASVGFNVIDDEEIESGEQFSITLSNPVNGVLDTDFDFITITINDNDNFGIDGPGGVGDADGSGTLVMWVIADSANVSGSDVVSWENEVGISELDLTPPLTAPTVVNNAKNGHAEISFANVNDVLSTATRLSASYFPYNEASTFIVTRHDNLTQQSNTYGTSTTQGGGLAGNRFSAHLPWSSQVYFDIGNCCGTDGRSQFNYDPAWVGEYTIFSYTASAINGKTARVNASQEDFDAGTDTFLDHTDYFFNIGQTQSTNFQGDILEFIMFTSPLNSAQVIIMENYLAAKYDLPLDQNDYYSFKTTHSTEVVGIGQEDASNFHNAAKSSLLTISNPSDLGDGEYVFVGHDNTDVTVWTTTDVPSDLTNIQRIEREFRTDITGDPGTISIAIDGDKLPTLPADYTEYLLLTDADGIFSSGATVYPMTLVDGVFVANNVAVEQGTYFTIATHRRTIEFESASTQDFENTNNTIILSLSVASGSDITIPYTISGTATPVTDFSLATSGSFVISAGRTTEIIDLGILDESIVESDETIIITLGTAPSGTILGTNGVFTYTINDDDNDRDIEFRNPCDYGFSKTITIDNTLVDDTDGADLTNFPLLISFTDADLASTGNGGNVQSSNGFDIAFTYRDSLVWLDHEIESYDETTGEYIAWVKIPVLDYDDDTELSMLYGNANITKDPSVTTVWSEYYGVWHLNGDVKDSSPNSYGGTNNGTADVAGKIGNGRNFDGAGDFIELASFPNIQTDFSISAFVNPETNERGQRVFIDDDNNSNGYALSLFDGNSTGRVRMFSRGAGPTIVDYNGSGVSAATGWHYVAGVIDVESVAGAGSRTIYADGVQGATGANGTAGWGIDVGSAAIGGETLSGETGNRFNGQMDEVRVYNGLLSTARVITEYNNYDDPASFYTVGTEVVGGACLIAENTTEELEITVAVNPIDNISDTEVTYTATGGSATNNEDYTLVQGVLTIPAGSQSATFKFPVINDLIDEQDETIEISLSNPSSNAKLGTTNTQSYTITDDDDGPEIGFVDTVSVANEGTSVVAITLELGLESGNDVSVDYAVTGGDAVAGTDYIALSGTATIPAGDLTTTISFQPIDDADIETPETVQLTLTNPINGSLRTDFDIHEVTIADNDDLGFEGPGGVGDVENALGENLLKLWLIADSVSFSGSSVTSWNNLIQNVSIDYDMVPVGTAPDVVDNAVNGHKEISFNNVSDALVSEGTLSAASFPGNEMSFFIVAETDNLNQDSYAYATDNSENGTVDANSVSASLPNGSGNAEFDLDGDNYSTTFLPAWTGNHSIFTHIVSSDTFLVYRNNGVLINRDDANPSFTGHTAYNFYLGKNGSEFFQGDIAEVIMFSRDVNVAQSNIINNYLAAKYNLSITNDFYNFEVSHGVEVAGIGQVDANNQHVAARAGIVTISNADDLDDGEYVLFGHDNEDVASWTTSEVPVSGIQRTAREWRFDNTGAPGTISIAISNDLLPPLPNGDEDYIIMQDADGDFTSGATIINTVFVDGQYKASNLSIASGDYVTFGIATRTVSFSPTTLSGSETVAANAQILLSLESSSDITLDYEITDGTATGGNDDYSLATTGQVTFIAGQTSVNLPLGIINDSDVESDETIEITLSNPPTGVMLSDSVFTYTINDDDNARNVQFNLASSSGAESVSAVSLQVDLNIADPVNDTKVYYSVTGGTAEESPAPDYVFVADTLTIPATQTTGNVDFTILDDVLSEATETMIISLSSPINANLGTNVAHTYSITDNDASVSVEFQNAATTIDEGGSIAELIVELSSTSGQDVSVDYAVTEITATGLGVDFALADGTLVIPAGSQLGSINVALTDDGIEESAETFSVTLSGEVGATLGAEVTHTVTISDNDATFGYYGPGGVGDSETNMLWLDAYAINGKGVANVADGSSVNTWVDRSGNGFDFTAIGSAPSFDVDALNLKNTVIVSSTNQGFQAPAGFSNALSNYTFVSVLSQTSGDYLVETNTAARNEFRLSQGANGLYSINDIDYLPSQSTNTDLTTWRFDSQNASSAEVFRNGSALLSDNNYQVMAIDNNFALGSRNSDQTQATSDFAGNISEFIVYRNVINDAQRVIVENYLANKYDLTIPNDYYSFEGTYGNDVVGIGRTNDEQHLQSMSDSLLMISGPSDLQNDEFVFAGHDNGDDLNWTSSEAPSGGSNVRRLAREWRLDIQGDPGTIIVMIDTTQLPTPPSGYDQYVVYTDEDGDFRSGATTYQVEYSEVFGFHVTNEVTINSGTFITIGVGQPVIQYSLTENSGNESVTNPTIEVALNFTLGEDATVNYAATGGTAVGGNIDYLLTSGTLTIAEGQSTADISLGIIDDTDIEGDETIEITLTTPSSNVSLGSNTVFTYTIHDDDNPEGRTVDFATAGPGAGDEATPSVTPVTVNINTPDDDVVTSVDLQVISSGANAADETDDFILSTSTISFPADNVTVSNSFNITVVDDAIFEGTETITLRLTNPVNADLGSVTEYTLDITDNDTQPVAGFVESSSFVSESAGIAAMEVTLDAPSVNDVTVNYTVTATATPGADYTLSNGSVLISAGSMSEDIQAVIVNDLVTEAAENITVTLTTATNATVSGTTIHVVTILDDDQSGSTGPGGVGDATTNLLWLRGDNFTPGTWTDISGNSNDFTGAGPSVGGTGINSQNTVEFSGAQSLTSASGISASVSDFDIFFVADADVATDQALFNDADGLLFGVENSNGGFQDADATWKGDEIVTGTGSPSIIQYNLESGSGLAAISLNGTVDVPTVPFDYTATSMSGTSTLGSLSGGGSGFDGEMAEVLVYNIPLNDAQTIIVNNYLSTRYDIAIPNDNFAFDDGSASNDYFFNLIGIGREDASNIHVTATADNFLTILNPNNLEDAEYLMIANDGADMTSWTFTGAPANGSTRKVAREWRVDKTGDVGTISFQIDTTALPTPPSDGFTWALIVTSDGDFTDIDTTYPLTPVTGDVVGVDGLNFTDGDYFSLALIEYVSTGVSSDFSNPLAWTTGVVPTAGTKARILDAHSLFLSEDVVVGALTLEGTGALNLAGFTMDFSEDCIILNGTGTVDVSTPGSTIGYVNPNVTEQCVTGMIYNNLYTDGPAGSTKYLTGNITVQGDINLQSSGGAGAIFDSRDLGTTDDYNIELEGDWLSEITFLPRTGTVTFDGFFGQTINTSGGETFNNLTINKVGMLTMADSTITLSSGIATNGVLTLTSGFINTTAFDITINNGSSIVGGDERAYFIVDGVGVLRHAITALSTAYEFPIGDSDEYAPFTFTLNSGTLSSSSVTINMRDAKHTDIVESSFITRYWTLENENITGTLDYDVSYIYEDADIVGTESALLARKFSSAGDDLGGSVTIGTNTISNTGYDSFSDFTAESAAVPLPVSLLYFTGEPDQDGVLLQWETATETNNSHFEVLRSLDGETFTTVGIINGNGNSSTPIKYSLMDTRAAYGLNYYQLKQFDFDNTEHTYATILVDNNDGVSMSAYVYPNPAREDNFNIRILSVDRHTPITIKVIDLRGNIYFSKVIEDGSNFDSKILPEQNMVEGIYFMIVEQGNQTHKSKVIIK